MQGWQDRFFLWWPQLDNPPTAEQLQCWRRMRALGRFRYLLSGALQYALLIGIIANLLGFLIVGNAWNPISPVWLIAPIYPLPQLYKRWNNNERMYLAQSAK